MIKKNEEDLKTGGWLKRAGFLFMGLLAGLVLTVAALLVVFDETDYQRALAWSADRYLDSELVFQGPLSVRYSEGVLLSAEAFQIHAHDDSYSLETNALNLNFQLASVFSGALWINSLSVGDFILKVNESEDDIDFSIPPVVIARAQVNSLLVEYQEASPGTLHKFTLDNLIIDDAGADGPVKAQASGMFKGHEFTFDGVLPALDKIQDTTTPKPVRLDFVSEKLNASLEGSIADPLKGRGLDLKLQVNAEGVDEFLEIFEIGIPTLGKLDATAMLRGSYETPRLEDIDLRLQTGEGVSLAVTGEVADVTTGEGARLQIAGKSDNPSRLGSYRADGLLLGDKGKLSFRGNVSLGNSSSKAELDGALVDGKPHLTGKLELLVLSLDDFGLAGDGGVAAGQDTGSENDGGYVFSREPLNISFLNSFNLELDLLVHEVTSKNVSIDSIGGHVSIRDGHLSITPFHLNFEGGHLEVVLDVQDAAIPEYKISVTGDNVKLGSLLTQVEMDVAIRGSTDVDMDLEAKGHSPHELAASLNGTSRIELENARIPQKYISLISADVLGWVGSKSLLGKSHADLNCVVMSFDSTDGMVSSGAIISSGPNLNLGGSVNLDLGEETLDIVLIPEEKKRLFSSISPVKITGPMNNPHVEAIPAKAAIQKIGTMALLPGVVIPVGALEKVWGLFDEGDKLGEGCKKLYQVSEAAEKEVKKGAE